MTSEASFCISHMKYSFSYIILKTNEKHESFSHRTCISSDIYQTILYYRNEIMLHFRLTIPVFSIDLPVCDVTERIRIY